MNIQNEVNAAMQSAANAIAVSKMVGSNVEAGMQARTNINSAKSELTDNSLKIAGLGKVNSRTDVQKYTEALDSLYEERQTMLDQKNDLVAYYQSLYKGVDEEGNVSLKDFHKRLIPKDVKPKLETVPDAYDVLKETLEEKNKATEQDKQEDLEYYNKVKKEAKK